MQILNNNKKNILVKLDFSHSENFISVDVSKTALDMFESSECSIMIFGSNDFYLGPRAASGG